MHYCPHRYLHCDRHYYRLFIEGYMSGLPHESIKLAYTLSRTYRASG